MITRLRESVASSLEELKTPVTFSARLNGDISDLLKFEWDHCNMASEMDVSPCQVQPVIDTLSAVQFQNALEDVGYSLENCQHNMMEGIQAFLAEDCSTLFGVQPGQVKLASVMLLLAKELLAFHVAASDCLQPVVNALAKHAVQGLTLEDKEKSGIILAWKSVHEVNKLLRIGYGLSEHELSIILAWMHGEDLSESTRKALNQQVDGHIQLYRERLAKSCMPEVDVPVAFSCDPALISDVLKDCCSPAEIAGAIGQKIPMKKEDLESLLHRELPRIPIMINGMSYEVASPGKAYENTKQKMHAVRDLVNEIAQSQKLVATREQLDLFSMRVLATVCTSVANAASRVAVLMAFGKANLVQVKPPLTRVEDRQTHIRVSEGTIGVDVPSTWWLVEDSALFSSLCRDQSRSLPIATVDAIYQVSIDAKAFLEKRMEPLPVVHVQRLPMTTQASNCNKKDQAFQKQFSLRTKLSKATKLFNRRSGVQKVASKEQSNSALRDDSSEDIRVPSIDDGNQDIVESTTEDGKDPVPPPRPRRKARKSKRAKSEALRKERAQQRALEEAKKDMDWFLTSSKAKLPAVQALKGQKVNASVASFEELQEVIDFLSGSSTSSLCLVGTTEGEKSAPKDAVLSTSKLVRDDQVKDEVINDPKVSAESQECSSSPCEDKGKTSPVDSGLGSTASFLSSLSSASTVSVITTDHVGHTTGEHTPSVSPESQKIRCTVETIQENSSKETIAEVEKFEECDVGDDAHASVVEEINSAEKADSVKTLEEVTNSKEEMLLEAEQEQKDVGTSEECDDVPCGELEVWKDPGIVEAFDYMLESPQDDSAATEETVSEVCAKDDVEDCSRKAVVECKEPLNAPLVGSKKAGSNPSLKGSTESLYYSAWSINEFACKKDEDTGGREEDDTTAPESSFSVMTSGVGKASGEPFRGFLVDGDHCQQYNPFSSQYAWHDVMGENLGQLWADGSVVKNVEAPPRKGPWPVITSSSIADGNWNSSPETKVPEGSRLSQWTGVGAPGTKRSTLGAPLGDTWQSRSNPDVPRTLTTAENKMRFERAPSPLLGSRSEVFASSNWPGHQLSRRGSFPRAMHRDTGSPGGDYPVFPSRDGFSPRENVLTRADLSPTTTPRNVIGNFNATQPANQSMPVWPVNNDSRYWIRHDIHQDQPNSQSVVASRPRMGHALSLPMGVVRPMKEGESWNKVPLGQVTNFPTGQHVRDMSSASNLGHRQGNMALQDGNQHGGDPRFLMAFHNSSAQVCGRFPIDQRPSPKEQSSREAQFMSQANRLGQFHRNPRGNGFFPDNCQMWDIPK